MPYSLPMTDIEARFRRLYKLTRNFYWDLPLSVRAFLFFVANIVLVALFVERTTESSEYGDDLEALERWQIGLGISVVFVIWTIYPSPQADFFRQAKTRWYKILGIGALVPLPSFLAYTLAMVFFRYFSLPLYVYPWLGLGMGLLLSPVALLLSPFPNLERIIGRWQMVVKNLPSVARVNWQYWRNFVLIYAATYVAYFILAKKKIFEWYADNLAVDFDRWLVAYEFVEVVFLFFLYLVFTNTQVLLARYSIIFKGHYFQSINRKLTHIDQCLTLIARIEQLEKPPIYGQFLTYFARRLRFFIGEEISMNEILSPLWCDTHVDRISHLTAYASFATHFDSFLKLAALCQNPKKNAKEILNIHQKLVPILEQAEVVLNFLKRYDDAFSHWELLRIAGRLKQQKPELLTTFFQNQQSLEALESIIPLFEKALCQLLGEENDSPFCDLIAIQELFDAYFCSSKI
jgi:hypothetical protein